MQDYIEQRVRRETKFMIDTESTIRVTAKIFRVSKSTTYVDVTKRLAQLDEELSYQIYKILMQNKDIRAIHGGIATQLRWKNMGVRI